MPARASVLACLRLISGMEVAHRAGRARHEGRRITRVLSLIASATACLMKGVALTPTPPQLPVLGRVGLCQVVPSSHVLPCRLAADGNQNCWCRRTAPLQMSVVLLLQLSASLSRSRSAAAIAHQPLVKVHLSASSSRARFKL